MDALSLIALAKASKAGGGGSFTQQQADWNQTDNTQPDFIKHKPGIGTASAKDVPASGDATATQVVMGNDSRLTDSRPASDVAEWAKADDKPTYSYNEITDTPTLDTALSLSSENAVQNKAIAHELAGGDTQASGDVITISDGSNLALTSATSTLAPVQDLHGYSNPWVGGAGKNLVNAYGTNTSNGYLDTRFISEAGGYSEAGSYNGFVSEYMPIKANTAYTLSGIAGGQPAICFYDDNKTYISGEKYNGRTTFTITTPANTSYFRMSIGNPNKDTAQIEQGTQATAYEPYSNICPISGYDSASYNRCGVNVWDEETELGNIDNTTGENTTSSDYIRSKNYVLIQPNTEYCLTVKTGSSINPRLFWYDENKNYISNVYLISQYVVITSPSNAKYFKVKGYATTYNNDISINYPSTITTYQPYQGQTVTLTFENTVYSGVIDWCTGVVTVDKAMVDLGSIGWGYNSQRTAFYANISGMKAGVNVAETLCSDYARMAGNPSNGYYSIGLSWVGETSITIHDDRYTDPTVFKTAMDGVQLLYELATPITIQLTPQQLKTLAGYNTIYTDVGNISIAYQPDNVIAECKEYTDNAIPTVDSELDDTSLNPIANKPVAEAIADIVGDISDIDSSIEGSKQLTTTGDVITVSDSAETYLEELVVSIKPIQDLHGYEYPWVGGAGKNLWSAGDKTATTYATFSGLNISAGTYTLSADITSTDTETNLCLVFDLTNGRGLGNIERGTRKSLTFTTNDSISQIAVYASVDYLKSDDKTVTVENAQLEQGTQATSYVPYANICPISGYDDVSVSRCGKNLLPMTVAGIKSANTTGTWSGNVYTLNNTTFELLTDNINNVTGIKVNSTGASARTDLQLAVTNAYLISGNYIVNGCPSGGGNNKYRIILWDDTTQTAYNDYGDGVTATVNSGDNFITNITIYQGQTASNLVFYPMIRPATVTDPTYEPYKGIQTVTLTLDDTLYSGTVDFATGVVTVDKAIVDLGDLFWTYYQSDGRFYGRLTDFESFDNSTNNAYCSAYRISNYARWLDASIDGIICGVSPSLNVYVVDKRYDNASDLITAMDGVQLVYELATPTTIQLTPQQLKMLKGNNTITTDANGGMTIKYQPDNVVGESKAYATGLYEALLAKIEELGQ